ncbi:MAG: GntR family transcriptional regulator [Gracilibacteraceae bacterium]|jgi:DNA-binding GntR family transcriptional regulator|nr:GntR family transcriptional regulator [Gracilibacteraceae bacterium]
MKKIALPHNSLQTQVFKAIETAILDGVFAPGKNLTEAMLSEELGVSRTPVREALRQLELEGLVRVETHRGAVVVGISEKDIRDIYAIRMRIEALAARWAAQNATEDEISALRENIAMQEFYFQRGDCRQLRDLDSGFHALIYTASRSRPISLMLGIFHHHTCKVRNIALVDLARAQSALAEHQEIFQALMGRDGEKAAASALRHIERAGARLAAVLAETKEKED